MQHYNTKHGESYGSTLTPEYSTWVRMKQRCYNPRRANYRYYGERGITVCDKWLHDYRQFLSDMGRRPEGLSLDRIDNDGDYEPSNCRWATKSQQNKNRRSWR